MKKVFSISLVMLMALCVFISCNPSSGVEDNVSVTLNAKNGEIDLEKENLSWKYTAIKSDGLDPKDGETEEEKSLNDGKTDSLSQGEWNFTLYGYKEGNLVCTGSVEKVEITKSNNTVDIDVSLLQKAEGTIVVSDDVAIKSTDGKTTYSLLEGYTMTLVISDKDGNVVTRKEYHSKAVFNTDSQTVKSGAYSITVTFSKDDVTATYTKNINVYDYLSTTISGSLNGVIIKADADKGDTEATTVISEDVFVTKTDEDGNETIENAEIVEVIAPISAVEETEDESASTTTVAFPAGSLKKTTSEETTEAVTLTVATATATAASASTSDYSTKITTTDAAVVAGFEFNLSGADSSDLTSTQTTEDGKEEEVGVTVTTYVAKGLGTKDNLKIEYIGENEGKDPEIVSYDTTTGKLVFTVYHFSKYAIVSTNIVAQDSNGNVYTFLKDAMSGATEGATVTLLKGLSGLGETIETSKSLTLDLNGYSIASSTRVFLVHKGTLTISNGTVTADITANNGSSVIKVDSASGDAGVVLKENAKVKAPSSYGITAFGTANKATLDIYGTIESTNPCLSGNGSESYFKNTVTMNIYNGAVLTKNDSSSKKWTSNDDKVAVYQPNIGVLNIYGGTITCEDGSAVEVRAGKANISGGTLKSNAAYSTKYNSDGPSVAGAAVAVSQHVTKQSVTVTISGGTFSGEKQLAVVDTLNDSTVDNKKLVEAIVKSNVELTSVVGYTANTDGNKTYYIDKESAVENGAAGDVKIGTKYFETIQKAFEYIKSDDCSNKNVTINILADSVSLGESICNLLSTDKTSAYTITFVGKGKDKSSVNINTGKKSSGEDAAKAGANYVEGAKLNFKDITVIIGDNSDYQGFVRSGDLTFTDCSIIGRGSCWGNGKVTFTKCVFEDWDKNTETSALGSSYAYNLWLNTGTEYYFDGCTFNSSCGRFINAYLEKGTDAATSVKVTIKNSTFNGRDGYTKKAALLLKNNTVWNVKLENIKTNYVKTSDAEHGNSSWYEVDDEGTCQTGTTVTIDGTVVWQNGSIVGN